VYTPIKGNGISGVKCICQCTTNAGPFTLKLLLVRMNRDCLYLKESDGPKEELKELYSEKNTHMCY
jgi:hypothetical protein